MAKSETTREIKVRPMHPDDADAVLAIDRKITGHERAATWQRKVDAYLAMDPLVGRIAEVDGAVVGFMLGDIKGWEYGVPESGWIEIMGVDPAYQGLGVGRQLAESLFDHFRRCGVKRVHTMIDWADGQLVGFCDALGFRESSFIHMEKDL